MDKTLAVIGILTLISYGVLAFTRPEMASDGLDLTVSMFIQAVPWIVVSMFAAGLLTQLLEPTLIARLLGRQAGVKAIFIGVLLGLFGTGSRWAVYPLAAGLIAADSSPGAVFAFVTSWQLVSLPRIPAEVPFFGLRFTIIRAVASIVIAIIGGWLIDLANV